VIFSTRITLLQQQYLNQFSHINQQRTAGHQVQLSTPHIPETKSRSLSPKLQGWATQRGLLPNTYLGQFLLLSAVSFRRYRHQFPTIPAARRFKVSARRGWSGMLAAPQPAS